MQYVMLDVRNKIKLKAVFSATMKMENQRD